MQNIKLADFSHPAFAPYRVLLGTLADLNTCAFNRLSERLDLRHANGRVLRFSPSSKPCSAAAYEAGIAASGCVPTRENNMHDFLNALVWLQFPQLKSAINLAHCRMLAHATVTQRGRLRDQLTLLDESGVLVASPHANLFDLLHKHEWETLFWTERHMVESGMTFIVVGHGLLEKCLRPFAGMTGKCLLLESAETALPGLDNLAAQCVSHADSLELKPLPVLGIPGWDENSAPEYYRNTDVFRPLQKRPQTVS